MSWLDTLLNFFRTKNSNNSSASELNVLTLDNIKPWLQQQTQQIIDSNNLSQEIALYRKKLEERRWLIIIKVEEWEKLTFNLSPELKEEVRYFFSETKHALNDLEITTQQPAKNISNELSTDELAMRNERLQQRLEKIIKRLEISRFAKEFHFLLTEQEKNSDHTFTNPLLHELLALQTTTSSFQKTLQQSGLQTIHKLYRYKDDLEKSVNMVNQLAEDLQNKQSRLSIAEEKLIEKKNELNKLQQDPLFKEASSVQEEKFELQQLLQKNNDEVTEFFTKLKPILTSYSNIEPNNMLVANYVNNPAAAFSNDEGLSIVHILQHVEAALVNGKLEINLDLMTKSEDLFEKIKENHLQKLQQERLSIQQKLDVANHKVMDRRLMLKIEEAKYRMDHFNKQARMLRQQISALEERINTNMEMREQKKNMFRNVTHVGLGKEISLGI